MLNNCHTFEAGALANGIASRVGKRGRHIALGDEANGGFAKTIPVFNAAKVEGEMVLGANVWQVKGRTVLAAAKYGVNLAVVCVKTQAGAGKPKCHAVKAAEGSPKRIASGSTSSANGCTAGREELWEMASGDKLSVFCTDGRAFVISMTEGGPTVARAEQSVVDAFMFERAERFIKNEDTRTRDRGHHILLDIVEAERGCEASLRLLLAGEDAGFGPSVQRRFDTIVAPRVMDLAGEFGWDASLNYGVVTVKVEKSTYKVDTNNQWNTTGNRWRKAA